MFSLVCSSLLFSPLAEPPPFVLEVPGEEPVTTTLNSLSDGVLQTATRTLRFDEVRGGLKANSVRPAWPTKAHLDLLNGERLVGVAQKSDGNVLHFEWAGVPARPVLKVPVNSIATLWLDSVPAEAESPAWLTDLRKQDALVLRNGDLVQGTFTGSAEGSKQFTMKVGTRETKYDFQKTLAVVFNSDLARVRKPKGPFVRVTTTDGSRIFLSNLSLKDERLRGETLFKDAVEVPLSHLISWDLEQGKRVELADLQPTNYKYFSYEGETFTWKADRNVFGRPLRSGVPVQTWDRGIGTHAPCELTYALQGKYRWFEAWVGLDSIDGRRGDVVLQILVDDREVPLPEGGRLTPAREVLRVRADLTKASTLKLRVHAGRGGHVQDCVNWFYAGLIP